MQKTISSLISKQETEVLGRSNVFFTLLLQVFSPPLLQYPCLRSTISLCLYALAFCWDKINIYTVHGLNFYFLHFIKHTLWNEKMFFLLFWHKKQMWFQSQICSWHLAWCKGCACTAWGWSSCGARGQVTNCLNQGHFTGVTALVQRTALRKTSSMYTETTLVWSHNVQAESTYKILYPFSIPSSPSWARNCHLPWPLV